MSDPQDVARELMGLVERLQAAAEATMGYCTRCGHSAWIGQGHTACNRAEVLPNDPAMCCDCGCLRRACRKGCPHHC